MIILDDKYQYLLLQHNWTILKSKHIHYTKASIDGHQTLLHRLVSELEGWDLTGKVIDHINGDGLDNRLENLQVVTQSQNMMKQRKPKGCTSNYKGVNSFRDKWRTRITIDGKTKSYGLYNSEVEAALAYNYAAKHHFGEYARLNEVA